MAVIMYFVIYINALTCQMTHFKNVDENREVFGEGFKKKKNCQVWRFQLLVVDLNLCKQRQIAQSIFR